MRRFRWLVLGCLLTITLTARADNPYPTKGVCGGLPQAQLNTPTGTCIGMVATGLNMPRGILPLADDVLLVTEMGSWERGHGRLSRLLWQVDHYERTTVLDHLDRPHGIVLGADGWIYLAEAGRILRLDPAHLFAQPQTVVENLPNQGLHPLKQILFDADGSLFVSMGAPTDHCENADGKTVQFPCVQASGARALGSIWKITSLLQQPQITVFASGLRNAMGMTFAPNGQLIATDNGRDFINRTAPKLSDAQLPHDEINLVRAGGDYGWAYCFDNNRVNPEYTRYVARHPDICRGKIPPLLLLPAHSAPLGITRYPSDGEIIALRGHYLVALHGYRDTGHRLIAFAANAAGLPSGTSADVIGQWNADTKHPMGAPVEVRASPTGKLFITDDRNGVVLRLSNQLPQ